MMLTATEAALSLGLSKRAVYALAAKGLLVRYALQAQSPAIEGNGVHGTHENAVFACRLTKKCAHCTMILRCGVVRLTRQAHNLKVVGSNPTCATIWQGTAPEAGPSVPAM